MEVAAIDVLVDYHAVVIKGRHFPVTDSYCVRGKVVITCGTLTLFRKPKDILTVVIIGDDPSKVRQSQSEGVPAGSAAPAPRPSWFDFRSVASTGQTDPDY